MHTSFRDIWHRTALPELLDIRLAKSAKDRLYRTNDDLTPLRKDIESTLRQRERDLFSLSRSVILYDVPNSHFEDFCASNPKAKGPLGKHGFVESVAPTNGAHRTLHQTKPSS